MRKQILFTCISFASLTSATAAEVNFFMSGDDPADTLASVLPQLEVVAHEESREVRSSTPLQVIGRDRMRLTGITDISDAMGRLPGVNLRDYGGAGGLKTISVRGLGSEHTAVMYDGVALSDCQSGQIDLSRYSLDNVKSLSLFAGDNDDIFTPAKVLASASSLYISTLDMPGAGEEVTDLKAQMRCGSFNFYNPFLSVSHSFSSSWSIGCTGEFIHSKNDYPFTVVNGDVVSREKRENSKMTSWHGELNGGWRREGNTVSGKIYYYDNTRNLPGPVVYYITKSNEHLRERNFFTQLQYKGRLSSRVSFMATAKFNWAASRYEDVDGKYPGGRLDNYYIQREGYLTGALLYLPCDGLSVDYSADWTINNLSSNTRNAIRPYRNTVLQSLSAKYNFHRFSVTGRLLYSLYYNDARDASGGKDQSKISPSVSVAFKPVEDLGLYLRSSYKNIFRMPTFIEAYFDNYGSINLDPEMTDQFNLGVTLQQQVSGVLSEVTASCDGYLNHVKNKIVAVPYNMFLWTMTNLGKVRVYGLDVTLSSTLRMSERQSFLITGSWSYQRAQIRTNPESLEWMKQVAYTPYNSGSASVSWLNPWANIAFNTTGRGKCFTTNLNLPETRIAGFFDFGVSAFRTFSLGKNSIELRVDVLNIFDKQYEIVAHYPMPGRSWRWTLEFEI